MKDLLKIIFYSLGFMFLIYTFNSVSNIYNMSIFHRVISVLAISGSYVFSIPLSRLLKKEFKNKNSTGS